MYMDLWNEREGALIRIVVVIKENVVGEIRKYKQKDEKMATFTLWTEVRTRPFFCHSLRLKLISPVDSKLVWHASMSWWGLRDHNTRQVCGPVTSPAISHISYLYAKFNLLSRVDDPLINRELPSIIRQHVHLSRSSKMNLDSPALVGGANFDWCHGSASVSPLYNLFTERKPRVR